MFIYSINKYSLKIYYVPGTALSPENIVMSKSNTLPALWNLLASEGERYT